MKYLFMVAFLLIAPAAMASPDTGLDVTQLLTLILGDKAAPIVAALVTVAYVWAQLRQLIPAKYLAMLPSWLITLLEFLAANKGQAANETVNDPRHIKRVKL